jgi:putative long chain acyl-CoA synthase
LTERSRPEEDAESPDDGTRAALVALATRMGATARNTAEWIRYGGLETDEEFSPHEIVARHRTYRLLRYFPAELPADAPVIVLLHPVMFTAEVWDISAALSVVSALHREGIDVWAVDFGRPEKEPGGLERTLTDHVIAVSNAVDEIRGITGKNVTLSGYSQGGMFAYQAAAYRRGDGIESLVTFGSPVDTSAPLPVPLSPRLAAELAQRWLDTKLPAHVPMPDWLTRAFFQLLNPVKTARGRVQFLKQLHDREALLPRERLRRYLDKEGYTAYPSPAFAELLEQFVAHNRMLEGGVILGDRLVTLADIDVPILTVVGEGDAIGHPLAVRAIRRAAPRADVYELTLRGGHFGLIIGSTANRITWPSVAGWLFWRAGRGHLPDAIVPADLVQSTTLPTKSAVAQRVEQAADLGVGAISMGLGVGRFALGTASNAINLAATVAREGVTQLPRLIRLENLQPGTAISLGLLLDEEARRDPEGVAFLFEDRVIRRRELKSRVDAIVKGMLSLGIRHGERIGVLMRSRPSSFSVVAAISRLGGTAVLLRPDGDIDLEAKVGEISWLVSDPEHARDAKVMTGVTWAVLGGGAGVRDLPSHVINMERIDPDDVVVPSWYQPNPRRASDVAFVLFAGAREDTKAMAITNRRWALSALSTASAAAMKPSDTVYSVTPMYHSSALLMAVGGAIAAGARFALASGTDRNTFWDEVRRYGATHVTYTWTSLREVAYGPQHPGERHHAIRLFIGSGMPGNLWERVAERFAPASVLEFYASAEGEAILANVPGVKVGSMGRALPGTAEVKVAAYDIAHRRLITRPDGLGRECAVGETGLLVARVHPARVSGIPLRSVFARDDAWQSTDDLFMRDRDGDLWLVDRVDSLIETAKGAVPPSVVRNALTSIPDVDLAVAYGVSDGEQDVVVGALTMLPGSQLELADLESAMRGLAPATRPAYVQALAEIPVTTWARPLWHPLRERGVPRPGDAQAVWRLGPDGESYELIGDA